MQNDGCGTGVQRLLAMARHQRLLFPQDDRRLSPVRALTHPTLTPWGTSQGIFFAFINAPMKNHTASCSPKRQVGTPPEDCWRNIAITLIDPGLTDPR